LSKSFELLVLRALKAASPSKVSVVGIVTSLIWQVRSLQQAIGYAQFPSFAKSQDGFAASELLRQLFLV